MGERNRPHVEITTQIGCPIRCKYCPQALLLSRYKGPSRLSMTDFVKICDRIPDHVDIHFSGMCEPFVNPEAVEMAEYAAKKNRLSIFTTLTGLDKDKYDRLRKIPYRWFCVHVPDGQLNTKMKCTPAYLDLLRYVTENRPDCEKFWFSIHGDYHPATIPIIVHFESENNLIDRAGNLDLAWVKKTEKESARCSC
ncbi:MAG: radical SAM protein [Clostridiales bacterium]|nr:radical SAM protein [Clostridiales bacterium]